MRSIHIIPILLSALFLCLSAQEIAIKPIIIVTSEVVDDYSIVGEFLYPSSSKFASTLPKDFYINKLKDAKVSKPDAPVNQVQDARPNLVIFENQLQKDITMIPASSKVPAIQDYHVVTVIYPFAQIPTQNVEPRPQLVSQQQNPSKTNNAPPIQSVEVQPYKQVNNENKRIQWKIKDLPTVNDFIMEGDKKVALDNSLTKEQIGTGEIGVETNVNFPKQQQKTSREQPKPLQPTSVSSTKPLLYNAPRKPQGQSMLNIHTTSPSSQQKEPITLTNKQILEEIERLRLKNHKWTLLIVILILIILLLAFLFMRCLGKRNVDFWQNLNKKLDNYRMPAEPIVDEQGQGMNFQNTELVQSEFE